MNAFGTVACGTLLGYFLAAGAYHLVRWVLSGYYRGFR
jgi:hypothetical protein